MFCTIVLVNWRRAEDTCICIESLLNTQGVQFECVVCENGSGDGSDVTIRKYLAGKFIEVQRINFDKTTVLDYFASTDNNERPLITLVLNSFNGGFARGNNIALDCAYSIDQADFVWFLNNDTEVLPDSLIHLVNRVAGDQTIGICGSTLIYAFDRKTVQALGGAQYGNFTGYVNEVGKGLEWPVDIDQFAIEKKLDYVSGASMLVSRKFLNTVGRMSEDYFLYYEEIDWALRAKKAGFKIGYAKSSIVFHKEGAALGSGGSKSRSLTAEYFGVKNRIKVTAIYFPFALPIIYAFSVMQCFKRCCHGQWRHARLIASILLGIQKDVPR